MIQKYESEESVGGNYHLLSMSCECHNVILELWELFNR